MRERWWKRPIVPLGLMVVVFFAISFASGAAAYYNTYPGGEMYDAGIIVQATASTAFGHHAPFYESADCLSKARCSFLIVHPAFVLYLVAPLYALAPSILTLFAVRSLIVAGAAVPLYWLTRQVTNSAGKGLLAAGLYLVWAPTLAGDVFSLHLESLLPLELFSLVALWQAGRYRWGLLVATLAFLTIEIAPIFVFLIALFFLVPYLARELRRDLARHPSRDPSSIPFLARARSGLQRWVGGLRVAELRYTLVLGVASIVAYVLLSAFMNEWGAAIVGVAAPKVPPGLTGLFYNNASHPVFNLSILAQSSQNLPSAEYWLILYALVGFIPLLSPRTLVIAVPWIGWTFLENSAKFTTIGYQYNMIAAVPIFIGLAYGLREVRVPPRDSATPEGAPVPATVATPAPGRSTSARRNRRRWALAGWGTLLAIIVVFNVLLSPIDPVLPGLGVAAPAPFSSDYFYDPFPVAPGFTAVRSMASEIPHDASVVASKGLFPLVANLPRAVELVPDLRAGEVANLPFDMAAGPEYYLTDLGSLVPAGSYLGQNVSNPARYGILAFVGSTGDGPSLLYEQGFTGAAEQFGPALAPLRGSYTPGHGLVAGPEGVIVRNTSSPSGRIVVNPAGSKAGAVWTGIDQFLPPGSYDLRLTVAVTWSNRTLGSNTTAVEVVLTGYSGTFLESSLDQSKFTSGAWTTVTLPFVVSSPVPSFEMEGLVASAKYTLAIGAATLSPA